MQVVKVLRACLHSDCHNLQEHQTPRPASPPSTKFQPFRLSSGNRPPNANAQRTTEELRLEELKQRKAEEAQQRRRVLARLQTAPAVLPHAASPRKTTKPKPFNLMSVALHEHEVAQRQLQLQVRIRCSGALLCLIAQKCVC
jgi:hypothetical protein